MSIGARLIEYPKSPVLDRTHLFYTTKIRVTGSKFADPDLILVFCSDSKIWIWRHLQSRMKMDIHQEHAAWIIFTYESLKSLNCFNILRAY